MRMGERDRNEQGRYEPEHDDSDILDAVQRNDPAGTQEVAEELGIARQSADYRLRRLAETGKVSNKKVGGTLVWSVEDDS